MTEQVFGMITGETIMNIIIASVLTAIGCFFIVRIGGKKSVSQMTMPQFVMMITVGSLIAQPLLQADTIIGTYITVLVFVLIQVALEFIAMKFKKTEPVIDSKTVVLVKDGRLQVDTLRKERITVDQLESQLRLLGLGSYKDLRTCTLEVNGKIGYEKKKEKDYLTYDDFVKLLDLKLKAQEQKNQQTAQQQSQQNMFDEVRDNKDKKNDSSELD